MVMFSISLFALMVGGVCGVALMCMLTLARRADDVDDVDGSHDRQTPLFTHSGAKAPASATATRRLHRAAARGEVACPPWARAVHAQTTALRLRATRT